MSWFLVALAAFIIGLSKAGLAVGLGTISTPMIAMVIPARGAIGVIRPLL